MQSDPGVSRGFGWRRVAFAITLILLVSSAQGQRSATALFKPWMDPTLSAEARANLALQQMTLDEKLALLHAMACLACLIGRCRSRILPMAEPDMFQVFRASGFHPSLDAAIAAGLDQEQPMADYFGTRLKQAVELGRVSMAQIDDSARRVLYAEFASGVVDHPIEKSVVDVQAGFNLARSVEEKSIVLLKNQHAILLLDSKVVHKIAVIGGHADVGMISGGGSAQADPPGRNAILPPGEKATHWQEHICFPPLH